MHKLIISLFKWETNQIVVLQDRLWDFDYFLGCASAYLDSKFILFWLIPLLGAIDTKLYAELLVGAFLAIYSNVMLKWITAEDRPYWWIRETSAYSNLTRPTFRQTEQTCETAPGFPSGHVMFASTILVIVSFRVYEKLITVEKLKKFKILLKIAFSLNFALVTTVLTLSRLYLGCHFLHQCVVGLLLGVLVGLIVMRSKFNALIFSIKNRQITLISAIFVFGALSVYWIQKMFNVDPLWSIKLAFKWCEDPFYLKPHTTPVYNLVEAIGIIFSIAFLSPLFRRIGPLDKKKSIPFAVAAMIARKILSSYTPKFYGVVIYYIYTFLITFAFSYIFMGTMPKYCSLHISQD